MERTVRTFALDCAEPYRLTGCGNGEKFNVGRVHGLIRRSCYEDECQERERACFFRIGREAISGRAGPGADFRSQLTCRCYGL
jgi:hypothetical protein